MASRQRIRTAFTFVWALIPLGSAGLATPFIHLFAAARLRNAWQWATVAAYAVVWIAAVATMEAPIGSTGETVFFGSALVLAFGGTAHAFAIRGRVFRTGPRAGLPPLSPLGQAIEQAQVRDRLREQAREVARTNPVLAHELRIGRPDLPRSYDDGGLVDVNHCPADVLVGLPGMTPELAERVVLIRAECGGFVSVEEMMALAEVPPRLEDQLAEYTVFVR